MGSTNVFFQRYNPTLYKVQLNGINGNYSLVFLESFRKGWNAYIDNNIYNCSNYSNSKNSNKKDNNSGVKQGELLKLCDHSFYDSWFMPNVDKYNIKDGSRRTMGNYANIWNINVDKICNNSNICVSNGDGSEVDNQV